MLKRSRLGFWQARDGGTGRPAQGAHLACSDSLSRSLSFASVRLSSQLVSDRYRTWRKNTPACLLDDADWQGSGTCWNASTLLRSVWELGRSTDKRQDCER